MSKPKVVAFVYDFPHQKSVLGLLELALNGYDDVLCIAAPKRDLNLPHSPTRIAPIHEQQHPWRVARRLGFEYEICPHKHCQHLAQMGDVGIILGARVLPPNVTGLMPIVNLHPGLLPQNRGLDNVKWAITKALPQVVTAHVIDEEIDRGFYLSHKLIDVFPDDTLMDVHLRLFYAQFGMIAPNLELALKAPGVRLAEGAYHRPMTPDEDAQMLLNFPDYKRHYRRIVEGV